MDARLARSISQLTSADIGNFGSGITLGSDGLGQFLRPRQGRAQAPQISCEVGVGMRAQLHVRHRNALLGKIVRGLTAEGIGGPLRKVNVLSGLGDRARELNRAAAVAAGKTRHDHAAPAVKKIAATNGRSTRYRARARVSGL